MSKHYLEDHDTEEVTYLDAKKYNEKLIQEMENEIANALNEVKNGNIFEENNNRVDLYPGTSNHKLQKNQGKNPEDEEFFISKPPQYALSAYKPSGNAAKALGLTNNPRKGELRDLNKDTRSSAFKFNKTLTKIQNKNTKLKSILTNMQSRLDTLKRGLNSTNYKLDTLKSRARETRQRTKALVTTSMGGNKRRSSEHSRAVGPNGSRMLTKKHRKSVTK